MIKQHCPRLRRLLSSAIVPTIVFSIILLPAAQPCLAYDNDTHFWFTYYLAIKAGYTRIQAAQIASADVIVDFDEDTQPVMPSIENLVSFRHPLNHFQYIRNRLHALPTKMEIISRAHLVVGYRWDPVIITDPKILGVARQLVKERKIEFWKDTLQDASNPGVFIHFLEDTFSHDGFASYIGHAGYYRVDYMASDRAKAEQMAFVTLRYLIAFREVVFGKKPAEQFLDPEGLNLSRYLKASDIAEIRVAVQRFSEANPSTGAEPNKLVTEWNKMSDKDRREPNNIPPPTFVRPFLEAATKGPVPDSARARETVRMLFGYKSVELPYIWAYDLKDTGLPDKELVGEAYVYKENGTKPAPKNFTSDDEKANKEKKKIFDAAKDQLCMPFRLVAAVQTTVPVCVN